MSTITLGYSIQGGLQVDVGRTLTLGYDNELVLALLKLILDGTIVTEVELLSAIVSQVPLAGDITSKLDLL